MTQDAWRPLGVDSDQEIAEYDALHDGVPAWIDAAYWGWVVKALTVRRQMTARGSSRPQSVAALDVDLIERLGQMLKIEMPDLRIPFLDYARGKKQLETAEAVLRSHPQPLQVADYLLAFDGHADPDTLNEVLERGKSAWTVGSRSGRPGLQRRVPAGVQVAADSIMARSGRAGVRLAKAWEQVYGLDPNASEAYRLAILAVEDASIPVVSPSNTMATLGTVLRQLEDEADWSLQMDRQHEKAQTGEVLVSMIRVLWHGQHDRHGGQPSSPGNVSIEEATVAVSLAVVLVQWFDAGVVKRSI